MFESFNNKNNQESFDDLNSEVEEIFLPNLEVADLIIISEMVELKNNILYSNYEVSQKFEKKRDVFLREISEAYSDEELESTALYHILIGTDPENIKTLDLDGEYSIKDFIVQSTEELNK